MLDTPRPTPPDSRPTRPFAAVVLALLVLGVGVFVFGWRLGVESSVGDELVYRDAGAQYVDGVFTANLEHPPLAKFLIGLGHLAFGGSLVADRVPSAVLGVLTGGVLFAITRRIGGPRAGLLAAFLWYVLPLHPGVVEAHVGRQATLEMPLLFFTACAVWAAQAVLERGVWWRWGLFGVAVGAATATKLTGASVAVVALALLWRHRRAFPRAVGGAALAGFVAVVVFLATYLPFGAEGPNAVRTVVEWQLAHAGRGAVQHVNGVNYLFPPWWSAWWFQAQYLSWAGVATVWVLALAGLALRRNTSVLVTALAGFTVAVIASPLKLPQYHDVLAPPLVVAAAGAVGWAASRARWTRVLAVVAVVPLLVVGVQQVAHVTTTRISDYRALAGELRDLPAGSVVVVWGDPGAVQRLLPQVTIAGGTEPDCSAAALVIDPTIANRMDGADPTNWERACTTSSQQFQRLELLRMARQ